MFLSRCRSFLRNRLRRRDVEDALEAELSAYVDLLADENQRRGMCESEARRCARLELGGLTQVKEQVRDARTGAGFETVLQDVQYAVRMFRRSPAFFVITVSTLALGIGFTTALFSIVNAVILRPLPYPEAARLMFLGSDGEKGNPGYVSYPDFKDWRKQNRSFQSLAAYGDAETSISNGDRAMRTHIAAVTEDFFNTLTVHPKMGRDFSAQEHTPGTTMPVIIGDSLWRGMFGSVPDVVGRTLKLLGGIRCTIVGVMPAGFDYPMESQVWTTAEVTNDGLHERTAHNFRVVGRLKPDVPASAAQREMSALAGRIKRQFPGAYQSSNAQVMELQDYIAGPFKASLLTLFAAVGLVLVIVCVNVANLLLSRGTARAHELAIRGALGAARFRLIRQLTVESLVLSLAGGAAGVFLASLVLRVLHYVAPLEIPRMETVRLDGAVLLFALVVSLLSGLLFGVIPAFTAARADLNETLKRASLRHSATRGTRRTGTLLAVSEIGLAFMLLAGTGLLLRSFTQLRHQPSGFEPAHVLTAALSFPLTSLNWQAPPPERLEDYRSLAGRVRQLPGVRAVGYSSVLPLSNDQHYGHFTVEGLSERPGVLRDAGFRVVSPGYFEAIGAHLNAGRSFRETDGPGTMPVVVVNAALARRAFPNADALGKRIWFDSFDRERRFMTIVGVVGDIREGGLNQPAQPAGYAFYAQHPVFLTDTNMVVKTAGPDPLLYAPAIRKILQAVNKDVPAAFDTMDAIFARSMARQRFETQMLGLFASLATLLAGIGIYGVLSYLVQQTRTEIGIRLALGADSGKILLGILLRGARAALLGALFGLPAILAIARLLSSMLYEVSPFDPITYGGASVLLFGAVAVASYVPARRATRIEPITALKCD